MFDEKQVVKPFVSVNDIKCQICLFETKVVPRILASLDGRFFIFKGGKYGIKRNVKNAKN